MVLVVVDVIIEDGCGVFVDSWWDKCFIVGVIFVKLVIYYIVYNISDSNKSFFWC